MPTKVTNKFMCTCQFVSVAPPPRHGPTLGTLKFLGRWSLFVENLQGNLPRPKGPNLNNALIMHPHELCVISPWENRTSSVLFPHGKKQKKNAINQPTGLDKQIFEKWQTLLSHKNFMVLRVAHPGVRKLWRGSTTEKKLVRRNDKRIRQWEIIYFLNFNN